MAASWSPNVYLEGHRVNNDEIESERVAKRPPAWTREEIILATDLYLRVDRRVPDATDPRVIEVCDLINRLPFADAVQAPEPRRKPASIELKISNIRAADPQAISGHTRGNKLDGLFWQELGGDAGRLRSIASAIVETASIPEVAKLPLQPPDDEAIVLEGEILFRLHRFRERNSSIVKRKKRLALQQFGFLQCEYCAFDFENVYGSVGREFMECHHVLPLHELPFQRATTLADLTLICANCHRMLHRGWDGVF